MSGAAIAEIAGAQHGVFTDRDVLAAGRTEKWLRSKLDQGVYRRVAHGVYVVNGVPRTWRQEVLISVKTAGPGAVASHLTAAHLWDLVSKRPEVVEVSVRRWRRKLRPFTVHESRDLRRHHVGYVDAVPVTMPERTVVDLGATSRWWAERALDAGIRQGLFTLQSLGDFIEEVARKGRRGVGIVRPMIEVRLGWKRKTESELEDEFRRLIDRTGLSQPTPQVEVHDDRGLLVGRADFGYVEQRLLIELDSVAHHTDRQSFRSDRARQNKLELLGWQVLRYTWWDVVTDAPRVVAELRQALAAAALRR